MEQAMQDLIKMVQDLIDLANDKSLGQAANDHFKDLASRLSDDLALMDQ